MTLEGLLSNVNAFAKKTVEVIADLSTSVEVWYQLRGLRSVIKAGIPAVSLAVVPIYAMAGCGEEETPCDTAADCDDGRYCSPEGVCAGEGYEGGDCEFRPGPPNNLTGKYRIINYRESADCEMRVRNVNRISYTEGEFISIVIPDNYETCGIGMIIYKDENTNDGDPGEDYETPCGHITESTDIPDVNGNMITGRNGSSTYVFISCGSSGVFTQQFRENPQQECVSYIQKISNEPAFDNSWTCEWMETQSNGGRNPDCPGL